MADVRPKKHLGQHFLTEPAIAERTARALSGRTRQVLEVGPGKGILTKALLELDDIDLKVIEIDSESVRFLEQEMPQLQGRVIEGDFLRTDMSGLFPGPFSVAGNFPYNISSQILFKVLDHKDQVPELVGMFQREVARRVGSGPGSKEYGILSVLLQTWYDVEYLFTIEPGSFFPPPKVRSGVIRMIRNGRSAEGINEKLLTGLVRAGFNQRRKTLRNALAAYPFPGSEEFHAFLPKRAEQLSVEDWLRLCALVDAGA